MSFVLGRDPISFVRMSSMLLGSEGGVGVGRGVVGAGVVGAEEPGIGAGVVGAGVVVVDIVVDIVVGAEVVVGAGIVVDIVVDVEAGGVEAGGVEERIEADEEDDTGTRSVEEEAKGTRADADEE